MSVAQTNTWMNDMSQIPVMCISQ
ncbi:unnamed protein product, partial [Iphiclides podalirius]